MSTHGIPPGSGASPRRLLQFAASLVLLVAVVVTVNCASAPLPTGRALLQKGTERVVRLIDEAVQDEERTAFARAVAEDMLDFEIAHYEVLEQHRAKLLEVNADYYATRQEFETLRGTFRVKRREFVTGMADRIADLKSHLEPAEWAQVVVGLREMDEKWEEIGR